MRELIGISIPNFPLDLKEFEGVLLFHEYPTTVIYEDRFGYPVIKEWVDCSDDGRIDRSYYYRITTILLKQYLSAVISHIELINQSIDGLVYFEDYDNETGNRFFSIVSTKSIPSNYKPKSDFYFKESDGVHLNKIIDYFRLNDVTIEADVNAITEVKQIADIKKSETIYIHLHKGKGIGFGTANTEYLAKSLLKFDRLYKEVALDHKLGITRGDIQLNAKKNEELLPYINTEVYGNIAASYGLLLRPVFSQATLFGDSDGEQIVTKLFSLIARSQDINELKEEYVLHSDFTIKSYKAFIDEVSSLELKVDLNFVTPLKQEEIKSDNLDYKKAAVISSNLENLTVQSEDKFTVKGKFRAINCDTGHFIFVSLGGEKYNGTFEKLVREASETINFLLIYEITIARVIKKEPGMTGSKIIDVINAFVEDKE